MLRNLPNRGLNNLKGPERSLKMYQSKQRFTFNYGQRFHPIVSLLTVLFIFNLLSFTVLTFCKFFIITFIFYQKSCTFVQLFISYKLWLKTEKCILRNIDSSPYLSLYHFIYFYCLLLALRFVTLILINM